MRGLGERGMIKTGLRDRLRGGGGGGEGKAGGGGGGGGGKKGGIGVQGVGGGVMGSGSLYV